MKGSLLDALFFLYFVEEKNKNAIICMLLSVIINGFKIC